MPRKAGENPPSRYQFVGGATLKGRTAGIRSTMIRRAVSESRAKRRRDAGEEIQSLLRQSTNDNLICACHAGRAYQLKLEAPALSSAASPSSPSQSSGQEEGGCFFRPIQPSPGQATTGMLPSALCQICGGRIPGLMLGPLPQSSPSHPSLLHTFQAGNLDPLLPYSDDANLTGIDVQGILSMAGAQIWPSMRPLDYSANCYRGWIFTFEDKLKLYIVLWSTCYHRDMLRLTHVPPPAGGQQQRQREGEIDSKEQLHLRALTIRRLREEINNIERVTSPDGLVMAILFLAVNISHRTGLARDKSPFSPPFTGLHTLDIYGSRQYDAMHWGIVHNIIRRFGGVASLKAFAIAWHVSIGDLMHAVNTLQKPIYPPLGLHGQVLNLPPPLALFQVQGLAGGQTAGLGFQVLGACISPPIRQNAINVFVEIGQYSRVIQHYDTYPCTHAVLDLLGDSRNLVHHRLFSLPNEDDDDRNLDNTAVDESCGRTYSLEEIQRTRAVYLLVRQSLILYTIHVTYPIPRSAGLREHLLHTITPLFKPLIDRAPPLEPLLLWCLVVVVICSGETAPGQLLEYVVSLCAKLKIQSRESLLGVLRSFAWVECAVPDAAPFWSLVGNHVFVQRRRFR
ncbi:hypothetical protein BJY01DRAFT_250564 [Aspergillus pseudoustus]|uniref:Fungal-specific transcription factor domain-containing protein n=1 Tax=Aspergillus pseudoustus TaxID=1810923 RepID=A0ABR4JGT0_9EURO